jgi:hypothetical protein
MYGESIEKEDLRNDNYKTSTDKDQLGEVYRIQCFFQVILLKINRLMAYKMRKV